MKIALVGGTGDIGTGFALRWAAHHEIFIGSRRVEKALQSAAQVLGMLGEGRISGMGNKSAVEAADVVVLCVPYEHMNSVTNDLRSSYSDQLVVSPVVPMSCGGKYFDFAPPREGCAALNAKALLPEGVRIVSAFHTIAAAALQDWSRSLQGDVMICGDDMESKLQVSSLAKEIKDLRPLDAGPLSASGLVESLTPMLLNVARRNKIKDVGIKIVQER
jgi:8-hydroxy-5-deazaflavin:NADPH oxidoreductase